MSFLILTLQGIVFGLFLAFVWDYFERKYLLQKTKSEGDLLIQEAQEKSETLLDSVKSQIEGKKHQFLQEFQPEKDSLQKKIQNLQSSVDKKTYKTNFKHENLDRNKKILNNNLSKVQKEISKFKQSAEAMEKNLKAQTTQLAEKIIKHFSIDTSKLKEEFKKNMEKKWLEEAKAKQEAYEKDKLKSLQKDTLFNLNLALNRFDKKYCHKRTIEPVFFTSPKIMNKVVGNDQENIVTLEKECGVDMLVNKEDRQVQIFGIDPVRRELGRLSLIQLIHKNSVNIKVIKDVVKKCKKNLFETIKKDGHNICKTLRLKHISPEIKNMMGALQYRYSFAQNQYHHCEEVGWLCGLLSSELSLSKNDGKRSGMFHDIGKAMDHSIEGSHAVIGADFLSKHGEEKEHVLHAVRAHHHDESPSTPLAYLVIAADAISGSRPGARRFTEDSYTKKLATLEQIIDSFKNVIQDAYIMSAGREMRVIVDHKKITDQDALDLSKKIAKEIEKECSYPGLIKVTVVRHSEAVSMTS